MSLAGRRACKRGKASSQKPRRLLQSLPVPVAARAEVSMDSVMRLPESHSSNDAILAVVERFCKKGDFTACRQNVVARQAAQQFIPEIAQLHGVSPNLASDRDSSNMGRIHAD